MGALALYLGAMQYILIDWVDRCQPLGFAYALCHYAPTYGHMDRFGYGHNMDSSWMPEQRLTP